MPIVIFAGKHKGQIFAQASKVKFSIFAIGQRLPGMPGKMGKGQNLSANERKIESRKAANKRKNDSRTAGQKKTFAGSKEKSRQKNSDRKEANQPTNQPTSARLKGSKRKEESQPNQKSVETA